MAATIDEALEILHRSGPELVGGNSNWLAGGYQPKRSGLTSPRRMPST
jgi:hypothetical protein